MLIPDGLIMKLHDLISEETVKGYVRRLTKTLRIKTLGDGAYSQIFQHPVYHNVAVKLCHLQDPKTIMYLRECEKRPNNPWLPNVVGIYKVTFHDEDTDRTLIAMDVHGDSMNFLTHIVFMQKLKGCTEAQYTSASRAIMATMPPKMFMTDDEHEISRPVAFSPRTAQQREKLKLWKKRQVAFDAGRVFPPLSDPRRLDDYSDTDWKKIAKHSKDAHVRELAELMVKIGADDIHEGNVMISPDGHPVITDPVAS